MCVCVCIGVMCAGVMSAFRITTLCPASSAVYLISLPIPPHIPPPHHMPFRVGGGLIRAEVTGRYRRDPRQLDEDEEAWFDTDEGGSSPPDYRRGASALPKHGNHTYVAGTNSPRPPVGLHRTNSMPPENKLLSISTVS